MQIVGWIATPFRWIKRMWDMLRELRTHEQQILSVRDLTAQELRENAIIVARYFDTSWSIQNVQETLRLDRWNQHATEWAALRRRHPQLWKDVSDAYAALQRTASHGAVPPSPQGLNDLADSVEQADL